MTKYRARFTCYSCKTPNNQVIQEEPRAVMEWRTDPKKMAVSCEHCNVRNMVDVVPEF